MSAKGGVARFPVLDAAFAFAAACSVAAAIGVTHFSGHRPLIVAVLATAQIAAPLDWNSPLPSAGRITLKTIRFVPGKAVIQAAETHQPGALRTARFVLSVPVVGFLGFMAWVAGRGSRQPAGKKHIGGPRLVDLTTTHRRWTRSARAWLGERTGRPDRRLHFGAVPLSQQDETQHLLAVGATGSGKSQLTGRLLSDAIRFRKGAKFAVIDLGAAFYNSFKLQRSIVLNPFDHVKSVKWSPFNEIREDTAGTDCARLASGLLGGGHGSQQNREWAGFAQPLLAAVLRRLWERGADANEFSISASPEVLEKLLEGCPEASILKSGSSAASGSVQFMIITAIQKLSLVMAEFEKCSGPDFSVRDWVLDGKASRLFITYKENQRATVQSLHSLLVGELSKAALDMQPNKDRRIFLFLDELSTLGRVDGLIDLLEKGRKFGVGVLGCIQSVAQLQNHYGREEARILMGNFRSLAVLSTPDYESADYFSRALGAAEFERREFSKSRNASGDGVTESRRRERLLIVSQTDIMTLPNLQAFVKIGSNKKSVFKTDIDLI